MKGAPAIRPKHGTLIEMLNAAAQSELGLVFVNRKEQDQDVPFARIREQALSVAADLVRRGVRKGDRVALVLPTCPGVRRMLLRRAVCRRGPRSAVSASAAWETR